jgi:hypothetical protein
MKVTNIQFKDYNNASQADDLTFSLSIDGLAVAHYFISSWLSIEANMSDKTEEQQKKISTFADFQNANISRLRDVIQGKTAEESLEYLQGVIESFSFEIWERKEKSYAAELLKNEIKKKIDVEKGKILPDYNPAALSKISRTAKAKKEPTVRETKEEKLIKLFMVSGLSRDEAEGEMRKLVDTSLSQTYEKGLGTSSEPAKTEEYQICKCGAFNFTKSDRCMVCNTWLVECEFCKNLSEVDTKRCLEHKLEGKKVKEVNEKL